MGRIVGVPWRKSERDEGVDGEGMRTDVRVMDSEYRERLEAEAEDREPVPRRAYIHKRDLEKFGYTVGCPGCVSVVRGGARQAHTEKCRRRLEEELKGDREGQGCREKKEGVP